MKYLRLLAVTCCYMLLVQFSHSARILGIFNFHAMSHFRFHEVMMKSLASAGHHVTMIGPYQQQYPQENITVVDSKIKNKDTSPKAFARANLIWLQTMIECLDILELECRNVISLLEDKKLKNFDIMFVELMPMYQCYLPLAKKMGIPVIGTLSARSIINVDFAVGHTRNPSILPTELFFVNVKMSFYERVINLGNEIQLRIGNFLEERKLAKFYNDLSIEKKFQNLKTSLVFLNNHVSLQLRDLAPNIISIGGINVKTAKLYPLPEQYKKFIDEAEQGVILFSLGSLASSDTAYPNLTTILKSTFAKIPQRVIWKYNGTIEGISDNVLLSSWVPQKEVLAHKNVVAFISHCGLSSTYEAIYFRKPMILLPIFAEQPSNAAILKHLEVGLYLNVVELTEEDLLEAINEVIRNQKYQLNMNQLSRRFKDEPISPEELVVFWTEYVLRHKGGPLMRSTTLDIPLYQYLLLDIFAFVAAVLVFSLAFMYFLVKKLLGFIYFSKNTDMLRRNTSNKKYN